MHLRYLPILLAASLTAVLQPASAAAQGATGLDGRWTLNRAASQIPQEVGFGADWLTTGTETPGTTTPSGGRGSRSGSAGGRLGGAVLGQPESAEDAARVRQLTAEVRTPSLHLAIDDRAPAVTVTGDRGPSRTFHPTGKEEVVQLDGVPVGVTTRREPDQLVVLYNVEAGKSLRYTFARSLNPLQLIVDIQFVERGGGDKVRLVYEPSKDTDTPAPVTPPAPTLAAAGHPAAPPIDQRPGAELKGLTQLGVVVEDLSAQAAACGLRQSVIESAVSKRLTDAGFRVLRNSDEDSYVYVDIITTQPSPGLCVSRYDAFLYTHTAATLSYQQAPVLVQVSLLHTGGLAGGSPASHADGVLHGIQEYVDQFAARIHDANK